MSVFKEEAEFKRVIFNVRLDLAERLEAAKEGAREIGRKLDVDGAVNEAIEKFLKKAEKKIAEMLEKREEFRQVRISGAGEDEDPGDGPDLQDDPADAPAPDKPKGK